MKNNILVGLIGFLFGAYLLMTMGLKDPFYFLLSLINCFLCVYSLFAYRDEPYTLFKANHLFILFFLVFANAMHYANGSIVSSLFIELNPDDYQRFQLMMLVIIIVYNVVYYHFHSIIRIDTSYNSYREPSTRVLVFLALFAMIIVLFRYRNNVQYLFIRGIEGSWHTVENDTNVMSSLLFSKIIRPLPFACFLIASIYNKSIRVRLFLFLMMLITLFPTSLARNAVMMYWLPVAILLFPVLSKPNVFVLIMLFGLLVVFPFFDNFRYYDGSISFSFSFDYLNTMNFDAGQEFMIVMKLKLITWGRQLMGALLFFIPRSLWPAKPLGSGATLAAEQGTFSNISMPFFAEGYINYGLLGILLFTFGIAIVSAFLDKKYWKSSAFASNIRITPYYLILVGAAFFIMRGDLMSSYSFTLATLFDVWFVKKISMPIRIRF